MLLFILRAIFIACVLSVVLVPLEEAKTLWGSSFVATLVAFGLSLVIVAVDMLIPRKSLTAISGVFFGVLVGMVVTGGAWMMIDLLVRIRGKTPEDYPWLQPMTLALGVAFCYLAVSFILQTKDDIRFIIPYVEFAKQTKGARPLVLDTSVIIDGRIADICETRIIDSPLVIPRMVLRELQGIADSSDKLRRNRGRRGLDMLNKLQASTKIELEIMDSRTTNDEPGEAVDQRLVTLTKELDGRIVTNDYNLNKIAQLRGVDVININDLANALKPVVLPGEQMSVKIIKPGEEPGQGVGYLEDGTMVVAEAAREKIGEEVTINITSVLQTSAGRMIFGRSEGAPPMERRRRNRAPT